MKFLWVPVLLASPAAAQGLIDYDLLMAQNADRVVVQTDSAGRETRVLDMGDGVTVTCDAEGCVGMDMTDKGALGCTFSIVTELRAFAEVCNWPLTEAESAALTDGFDRIGAVVAANAVPRRPASFPHEVLETTRNRLRAGLGADPVAACAAEAEGDVGQMLRAIVQGWQAGEGKVDPADSRLPVMNPCL